VSWPCGPWRNRDEVEWATLEWVDWFNNLRTISEAGFREVRIDKESSFGDSILPEDPQIREAMDKFGIDEAGVKEILATVTSLHIFARE